MARFSGKKSRTARITTNLGLASFLAVVIGILMTALLYLAAEGCSAFCGFNSKKQLAVLAGAINDSLPREWVTVERYEGAGCDPPDPGSSDLPESSRLYMSLAAEVDLEEAVDTMKAHQWRPPTRKEATEDDLVPVEAGAITLIKDVKGQKVYALLTTQKTIELII
ncbi:hypothetical protein [Spongiactinospora sp. 9N601]|uniref:hypothetical protein n=1 Tax=Spongiactinospora sp. 9N601 TaxID=3375149 RepID=UPI0037961E2C